MTQLAILSKNGMGASARSINVVGVGRTKLEKMKFESLYNKQVNFLSIQGGGYR